jgi:hypothetical protein
MFRGKSGDNGKRLERVAILSDYHYHTYAKRVYDPRKGWVAQMKTAHDERAMSAVEQFLLAWKPDQVFFNGDMIDAAQISKFDKELHDVEGFEQDVMGVRAMFGKHRQMFPDAKFHYLLGNHEERLERYLRQNAQALRWLSDLTYYKLFDAERFKITIYPYRERVEIIPGVLEVTHGDKVAQKSGYTAQRMMEAGISGVSGHVHRLGQVFKTDRRGTVTWLEGGCLCRLDPEYAISPNWQQGIVVAYIDRPNKRFHLDLVPVINGRIVYAGDTYESVVKK